MDTRLDRIGGQYDGDISSQIKNLATSRPLVSIPRYEDEFDIVERQSVPDADLYNIVDWSKDAFTDWNVTRNDINFDTSYGKYTRALQDKDIFDKSEQYLLNLDKIEQIQTQIDTEEDPSRVSLLQDMIKQTQAQNINNGLTEAYNRLLNNDLSVMKDNVDFNLDKRDRATQLDQINRYKEQVGSMQVEAMEDAQYYSKASDYWKSKHDISDYYTAKQLSNNLSFTDLDTYLYKAPNLLGSSASSIKSQILGTVGAISASGGANPLSIGAGVLASLASNMYSRKEESYAEVYQNYKDKVRQKAENAGVLSSALENAKKQLMQQNANNPEFVMPDDDKILNDILGDRLKSGNEKFDRIRINSLNGLESLYTDNMALSGWDAAEQVVEVMPLGSIAKAVKGTGQLAKAVATVDKATARVSGFKKALSDRIDDVVTFGIDKTAENLSKRVVRKKLADIGGRMVITGIMEGSEEGVQYIKGKQYTEDKFDKDPNIVKSWVKNLGTGARSIYAALTPWDPVYSDDAEFMENFKGGALLGGLTTGVIAPLSSYYQLSNEVSATDMVSALYADKTDAQDQVQRDINYSRQAVKGNEEAVDNAFSELRRTNIEGVSEQEIQQEQNRAQAVISMAQSPQVQTEAARLGIDPRTDDYNTYVALSLHHDNAYREASKNLTEKENKAKSILTTSEEVTPENLNLVFLKTLMERSKILKDNLREDAEKLANIQNTYGLRTSKTDLTSVADYINNIGKDTKSQYSNLLKESGIKDEDITVPPTIQNQLNDAVDAYIYSAADLSKQKVERASLKTVEGVKAKLDAYKGMIQRNEEYIQQLQNAVRGIQEPTKEEIVEHPTVEPAPSEVQKEEIKPEEKPVEVQQEQEEPVAVQEPAEEVNKDTELLNQKLNQLREQIAESRSKVVKSTKESHDEKRTYNIRRKKGLLNDPRTDQELGTDYSVKYEYDYDTKVGKALSDASNQLSSLYNDLKYIAGPLRFGYEENAFSNQLQTIEGTEQSELPEIAQWHDLKQLKDQLDEAIFAGDTKQSDKLADDIDSKIQEINNYIDSKEQEILETKEDSKPIAEKANEVTPVNIQFDENMNVQQKVTPEVVSEDQTVSAEPIVAPPVQEDIVTVDIPLTYDPRIDPFSHSVNYWLTTGVRDETGKIIGREERKFQGMEDAEYGSEFSKISTAEDLLTNSISEVVVRDYVDNSGKKSDAIYLVMKYNGKKYIAAITDPTSLSNNYKFNRLPYDTQELIRGNLRNLRNKILQLNEQVKKNPQLKIVPIGINRTNGIIQNAKDDAGKPINRNLLDTRFATVKDPYAITPDNTKIGITTGPLGNRIVRFGTEIWNANGKQLGAAIWRVQIEHPNEGRTKSLDLQLNPKKFEGNDRIADLILELLTSNNNKYITKDGVVTPFAPDQLLNLIVNYGSHTAVNPNDTRLDASQIEAKLKKQFYTDANGDIVIGNSTFTMNDLLTNEGVRNKVTNYIKDNFHWNIAEDNLWKYFAGRDTIDAGHPLGSLRSWFEFNKADKLTIIPNELEFTKKDVGLDESAPNGISMVGWYIKQGILQTDVKDQLEDAKLYITDVALENTKVEQVKEAATDKINEDTIAPENNSTSFDDLWKELAGPNYESTDYQNVFTPTVTPETATEWLTSHLDLTEDQVKIVPTIEGIARAGMSIMGKATEDAIYISSLAPEGTEYHEAWHRVSNLLISEKSRRRIYDRYNKRNKSKLTDTQIDEVLAEDFKQFMLDEAPQYDFETNNWFKKIWNFVKVWSKVGSYSLARIFYNMNVGKYKNSKVSSDNIARFRDLYKGAGANFEMNGTTFSTIPNLRAYNNILDGLEYALIRKNKVYFYEEAVNIEFDVLKEMLEDAHSKTNNPIYKELIDKFDSDIKPALAIRIKNLGLKAIEKNAQQETEDIDGGEVENANIGEHTIASYQVDKFDNAPMEVKFFFRTVPKFKFDDKGNKVMETEQYTGFPKFVDPREAWIKAANTLHDAQNLSEMYKRVSTLAQTDPFFHSIQGKFNLVMHGLQNQDKKIRTDSEVLLTKIETTLRSHKHYFTTGKIDKNEDGTTSIRIIDNTVDIKSRAYPGIWSQQLFYNRKAFSQNEDGSVSITQSGLADLNRFKQIYNNIADAFRTKKGMLNIGGTMYDLSQEVNQDRFKNYLVSMFNSIGIEIDKPTINELLTSGSYGNPINTSQYQLLSNFVTSATNYGGMISIINLIDNVKDSVTEQGKLNLIKVGDRSTGFKEIRPIELYNNRGFVKVLAQAYSKVHLNNEELKSLGAQGNMLYPISQNNFASDRINELNKDFELINKLDAVVYNKGSLILNHVKTPNHNPITLETFVNFRDASATDQGRDYFGITDREDYVSKMSMIFNDRIIFPTVADKKTYHTIRGIKLPHERISWFNTEKGYIAQYGDQVINQFDKYAVAELNAIELCLRQIDDTVDENGNHNPDWLEPSRRIKNYHTPNRYKDANGKWQNIEGNGTRFRFLTGVYLNINGKEKFISFNDPKKSAKENLQTAYNYYFGDHVTPAMRKGMLSTLISKRVQSEVKRALDYGLIKTSQNGQIYSLSNNLLDSSEIRNRAQHYVKSSDPVIKTNAEGYAIYDMLADYTTNSIISIMEIEKIFSGDPAYYKWAYDSNGVTDISIDKIKRLGSLTSTGINNRLDFGTDFIRPTYTVAELKDYEVSSPQYAKLEDLFIRGNVKDAIIEMYGMDAWKQDESLSYEELSKKYPDAVEAATMQAKIEVAGYKDGINVADAAVYVSPTMYRDMMRMIGQWSTEVEEAFNILTDPNKEDLWLSDPKLYKQMLKASLKPLKYMAFGNRLDEIPGLSIPYFNKMALFPLFKSIATGDIKPLYDRMVDQSNPLDMVMFNSAVKAGSRGAMSYKTGDQINNMNNLVVYNQEFKYLRQQLATDPHVHEEQMAGTQMLKVNLSNLRMDAMYGSENPVSGETIKTKVFDAMNKLSDIGKSKLQKQLFTEDGNVNITALGKMLLDDAKSSGANDNIISGLKTKDDAFTIPLSALSDNNWLESRFISMINKAVIDINLPGGAFIQRSTFGLEATQQNVITDKMLNNGKRLNMLNEDGSMDSIVSINLLKHIIPGYKNMTFTQAKDWLIDNNIIGEDAKANAIGYRIPTQSIASISPLRFVDVLPEIMGDTIVLPEEFTTLTGSDFDVDKLYVSRYQYEIVEQEVDGNIIKKAIKSVSDEEDSLKNTIVDMYLKVLTTVSNTNELKMSIDNATQNVKAILKDIESNKTSRNVTPFEVYSPSYQEDRKAEYTGGKAGIGPMALNNAHHILTQLLNPRIKRNEFTMELGFTDVSRIYDYPTAGSKKNGRILDWLSAMINAFVDIAKDPYIVRLNVNPWTYNMVTFLLRTGKGKQTFYFMAQPILKEIANEVLKTKGKYGIDQTKTPFELEQEAIERVLDKYDPTGNIRNGLQSIKEDFNKAQEYGDLFKTYITEDGEETSRARELILHPENFRDYNREQVRMYYAFKAIKPYSDDLANLVKYSKVDTKKMGKSFAEQRVFYNGLQLMKQNSNFETGEVDRFFKQSFLQTKLDNSILFGQDIFNSLLLRNTNGFLNVQDEILYRIGRSSNASAQILGPVIKSMEASVKSEFFNQKMQEKNINVFSMFYGKKTMAKRLLKFRNLIHEGKYPELLNPDGTIANDLLEFLLPNISNGTDMLQADFIDTSSIFEADKVQADNFINYWRELLDSNIPEIKNFAEDLIYYAFVTSGDNNNMNSFFNYVPNSWRIQSGYTDYIQNKTDRFNEESSDINWKDIFKNNWYNDNMVKAVKETYTTEGWDRETGQPTQQQASFYSLDTNFIFPFTDRSVPQIFVGEMSDPKAKAGNIKAVGWKKILEFDDKLGNFVTKSYPIFPPFVKIKVGKKNTPQNWVMYELVGYREYTDGKGFTQRTPVYSITGKKGMRAQGHVITEYGRNSVLPFNYNYQYDGLNAITTKSIFTDIKRSNLSEGYKKELYRVFNQVHPITDLKSYQFVEDTISIEDIETTPDVNNEYGADQVDSIIESYSNELNKVIENAPELLEKSDSIKQEFQDIINEYKGTPEDLKNKLIEFICKL